MTGKDHSIQPICTILTTELAHFQIACSKRIIGDLTVQSFDLRDEMVVYGALALWAAPILKHWIPLSIGRSRSRADWCGRSHGRRATSLRGFGRRYARYDWPLW